MRLDGNGNAVVDMACGNHVFQTITHEHVQHLRFQAHEVEVDCEGGGSPSDCLQRVCAFRVDDINSIEAEDDAFELRARVDTDLADSVVQGANVGEE